MLKGHGGNLRDALSFTDGERDGLVDFSASICRLPHDAARYAIWLSEAAESIGRYPDPEYCELRAGIGERIGLRPESILAGNGSTELIYLMARAFPAKTGVVLSPSYSDYADSLKMAGTGVRRCPLVPEETFMPDFTRLSEVIGAGESIVFFGNPNNPTGTVSASNQLRELFSRHPKSLFIVDESFADFIPGCSLLPAVPGNAIVVKSLTKFYGLPGLRLGFAAGPAALMERLAKYKEPWTINCVAEHFGIELMKGGLDDGLRLHSVAEQRNYLAEGLAGFDSLKVFPSAANFLFARIDARRFTAAELRLRLLKKGILIRDCSNFAGLDPYYFRIAVLGREQNQRLLDAMEDVW